MGPISINLQLQEMNLTNTLEIIKGLSKAFFFFFFLQWFYIIKYDFQSLVDTNDDIRYSLRSYGDMIAAADCDSSGTGKLRSNYLEIASNITGCFTQAIWIRS